MGGSNDRLHSTVLLIVVSDERFLLVKYFKIILTLGDPHRL